MTAVATTKIWAVKDNLERTVNYAANPEKTVDSGLKKAINYAGDEAKTENRCYVTGLNCNAETAYEEMNAVPERFGKTAEMSPITLIRASKQARSRRSFATKSALNLPRKCGATSIRCW